MEPVVLDTSRREMGLAEEVLAKSAPLLKALPVAKSYNSGECIDLHS